MSQRLKVLFSLVILFASVFGYVSEVSAQGSYGTGKLPNRPPRVKRELKTKVIVESVNVNALTFKGTDEITGDKFTYRASKRTSIIADKGLFGFFGKKELSFSDLQKGQRLEIKYNELLPTSVTEIKVLKPKDQE
jgi:hypothetical protein